MAVSWKHALGAGLCLWGMACSGGQGEDAGADASANASSLAVLQLEKRVNPNSTHARFVTGAKVARYRGIDGDALLRLFGANTRDLETCEVTAGGLDDYSVASEATVELLPVGAIAVRLGDTRQALLPRLFPALASTASGSFYAGGSDLSGVSFEESTPYSLSAEGSGGVGRFTLSGFAPPAVEELRLQGLPSQEAKVVRRAGDLVITWRPQTGVDRVEFDLFSGGSFLACAARDDGEFTISRGHLLGLEPDDNASMSIRRARFSEVDMTGVDAAYARVEASYTVSVQVR